MTLYEYLSGSGDALTYDSSLNLCPGEHWSRKWVENKIHALQIFESRANRTETERGKVRTFNFE